MDKILSARVDEAIVSRIGMLAHRLKTTKKHIIEDAIGLYAAKIEEKGKLDILKQTFGTWNRKETAGETVEKARSAFRESMTRHQK